MIYTNFKIKQSNGPGAECQIPFIISEERRSRMRSEGRQGQALPRRAAASWHSERSRPRPCSYSESEGDSHQPLWDREAQLSPTLRREGGSLVFVVERGVGGEKDYRHITTGDQKWRKDRDLCRGLGLSNLAFPNSPCFLGPSVGVGSSSQHSPLAREAQAALWLPNAALTLIWTGQGTQDESHSPI